jgi:hypothetical protein
MNWRNFALLVAVTTAWVVASRLLFHSFVVTMLGTLILGVMLPSIRRRA